MDYFTNPYLALIATFLGTVAADGGSHSRTGCGGQSLDIRCPGGTEIKIIQAIYGRFDSNTCQSAKNDYNSETKCSVPVKESQNSKYSRIIQ